MYFTAGGLHAELAALPGDPGGLHAQLNGRDDPLCVGAEQVNDGVAGEEGVRLGTVVRRPGSMKEKLGVFR